LHFLADGFAYCVEGFGEDVEQRDELRFLFCGGGLVLVGEPEDLDAGNGVEVWVAMHACFGSCFGGHVSGQVAHFNISGISRFYPIFQPIRPI
jgi:hypothetical protein